MIAAVFQTALKYFLNILSEKSTVQLFTDIPVIDVQRIRIRGKTAEPLDFLRFRCFHVFIQNEASGIRTPDNLIKSQVLYRLS